MQILDNIIILLLPVLAFIAGKRIGDSYSNARIQDLQYQLRLMAAEKGVGYIQTPVMKRVPIGQNFMDKLKENGRATQRIVKSHDTNVPTAQAPVNAMK